MATVAGKVCVLDGASAAAFRHAVLSAASATGLRGGVLKARRERGGDLRLFVVPVRSPSPGAMVLIEDMSLSPSLTATLMSLYGLTSAEAAIADLLAQGLSPTEIAEARVVGIGTIRSQLKTIVQKLEVRNLGDALRNLGKLARPLVGSKEPRAP